MQEQILNHIDFQYCTKYSPHRIYYHTSQKKKLARFTKNVSFELHDFVNQERPLIFIDDGSKQLPSPEVLSRFQIVLTSYNRLSAEWKFGSVEQELKASKRGIVSSIYDGPAPEASHLLKVHWLRLIVDEGHVMGKNPNNAIQFAQWIIAQRRWCMTGTPTQQIGSQNGLRNLFYLANFLKHEFFSRQLGREHFWNELINRGWKEGHLSSFFRLKHMISFIMVRHTKSDLIEIPQPTFSIAHISLSKAETTTYNTIASGVRTNIITTSMQGKTSGWQDSLLNPRQSKHASEALRNLRIACCGGLQIVSYVIS